MDSAIKEMLQNAGVDMERTLDRFLNNEALFEKFLRKFSQDKNYAALEQAIKENDLETIERAAHTLKGVSANLGLDPIANLLNELVLIIRAGKTDNLQVHFDKIQKQYDVFCRIIGQLPA